MKIDKNVLLINRNSLDEECAHQPQLLFEWGEALARASLRAKEAKNRLKVVEAEIAMDVRSAPQKYGLDKITESSVAATVLLQPQYEAAHKELITAEYEEELLSQMVKALSDRRSELENLVRLHGQMYWSKPDTTATTQEDREAAMRGAGSKVKVRTMRD